MHRLSKNFFTIFKTLAPSNLLWKSGMESVMKRLILLFTSLLLVSTTFAASKSINPKVILKSMEAVKTIEKRDELYLAVTEFPSEGLPSHYQLPKFPMFWPSDHLHKVANFKVWSRELKNGEGVTLILALIDKDAPPWNTDDLIGEVKLHLKNENGKLISSWSVPDRDEQPPVTSIEKSKDKQFDLRGEGAHYKIRFVVKK